jgi:hypothetical protein
MLGFLYAGSGNVSPAGQPYDGLTGTESNPASSGPPVIVFKIEPTTPNAYFMPGADPGEGYMATSDQLFGSESAPARTSWAASPRNPARAVRDWPAGTPSAISGFPPCPPRRCPTGPSPARAPARAHGRQDAHVHLAVHLRAGARPATASTRTTTWPWASSSSTTCTRRSGRSRMGPDAAGPYLRRARRLLRPRGRRCLARPRWTTTQASSVWVTCSR